MSEEKKELLALREDVEHNRYVISLDELPESDMAVLTSIFHSSDPIDSWKYINGVMQDNLYDLESTDIDSLGLLFKDKQYNYERAQEDHKLFKKGLYYPSTRMPMVGTIITPLIDRSVAKEELFDPDDDVVETYRKVFPHLYE